jgi:hypothetical protein
MDIEILASKNVWWKGKEYLEKEDEDYKKWKSRKVRWIPELIEKIHLDPFSLHFILGPRQVGKTTLIKLLIKKILEEGGVREPKAIFYFRCDELKDYKELKEILDAYLELRKSMGINNSYIFLDEITFPKEWFRTIKGLIDDGVFKKDVLVLTGSTSLEIKKETEYFPGRRGKGKNFFLFPLSFREFVKVKNKKLFEKLPPEKLKNFKDKEIKEKAVKAMPYIKELNEMLKNYFEIGGFPLAINSFSEFGHVTEEVLQTYISWIINDITKVGRSSETAREIIKVLLTKIPSTISWESIAKEITIKSPKTVNFYTKMLKNMFVLNISYHLEPNKMLIEFAKNKKIHFSDPLFYKIFEEWCIVKISEKENKIAENCLASHLSRSQEVFYWKNNTEIDCVIRKDNSLTGFEVKFGKRAEPKKIFIGKIKEVYVLSKNDFDLKNKVIPLSIFLSVL